jgi:hypothetical protein
MSRLVICYKCGNRYDQRSNVSCPKCGEGRIFEASKDDPNFDMYSDVSRVGRNSILGVIVVGAIWAFLAIYLGK